MSLLCLSFFFPDELICPDYKLTMMTMTVRRELEWDRSHHSGSSMAMKLRLDWRMSGLARTELYTTRCQGQSSRSCSQNEEICSHIYISMGNWNFDIQFIGQSSFHLDINHDPGPEKLLIGLRT